MGLITYILRVIQDIKGLALRWAAGNGPNCRPEVVSMLLRWYGTDISAHDKGMVLLHVKSG